MTELNFNKLNNLFLKYKGRGETELVIPVLQEIQNIFGYLPQRALEKMSRHYNIPLSYIYGVATFYKYFTFEPRGKNIIRVCDGTACHIKGARSILKTVEDTLGIKPGGTTKDFKFSLEVVRCLGICFLAPVMVINQDYYGRLTPEKVKKILKRYK